MKALKIDYFLDEKVKIIDYKPKKGDITFLQTLINCRTFSGVGFNYKNQAGTIFFDDEGLIKQGPKTFFYIPDLYPLPICGNGVILGLDVASGESISIPKALSDDILSGDCVVDFPNALQVVQIERDLKKASGY